VPNAPEDRSVCLLCFLRRVMFLRFGMYMMDDTVVVILNASDGVVFQVHDDDNALASRRLCCSTFYTQTGSTTRIPYTRITITWALLKQTRFTQPVQRSTPSLATFVFHSLLCFTAVYKTSHLRVELGAGVFSSVLVGLRLGQFDHGLHTWASSVRRSLHRI
jgi:hypothetical protein